MASYEEIKRRARNAEPEVVARRTRWFLVGSVFVTLLLYYAPYGMVLGLPLLWLSTFVHELGHGLTAALVGGNFESFVMHADGSGATSWSAGPMFGPVRRALVAAGGLVGPAVAAAIGFVIARKPKPAQVTLLVGTFALVVIAVLVVRNPLGWAFTGGLALLLGILATRKNPVVAQLGLVFLSTQLAMAVFSRGDYLFTEYAQTAGGKMPSDVAQMAEALLLPYWVWGGLCGLFSVAVLGLGLWIFFRGFDSFRGLAAWRRKDRARV
ncbi:MAG: M50 family metallopeptidase [Enhygromyxa sp.]